MKRGISILIGPTAIQDKGIGSRVHTDSVLGHLFGQPLHAGVAAVLYDHSVPAISVPGIRQERISLEYKTLRFVITFQRDRFLRTPG